MNIFYKKLRFSLFFLTLLLISMSIGCTSPKFSFKQPLSRTEFVLGTTVTISLYTNKSEATLDKAFYKCTQLENLLSINKDDTLIDRINANAGIQPVQVDDSTFSLIQQAVHYSELTDGAFDLTIGPLVKLWHIGFDDAKVPTPKEISEKLPLVDYHKLELDSKNKTVYLMNKDMSIDLGGIAKGYAADQIAALLRKQKVEHAIINLGGNVYAIGDKPDHTPWTIGIQDPFNPLGQTIGTIKVQNKSVVTSGIYERYIKGPNGEHYHHILDPKTGYPYDNGLVSVTIISDNSTDADALSTSAFALGPERGLKFIESLEGIDAIFITTDRKVYTTSGLTHSFILTNTEFSLS